MLCIASDADNLILNTVDDEKDFNQGHEHQA